MKTAFPHLFGGYRTGMTGKPTHYRFLADLRQERGSDVVPTRLLGIPVIGIGGPEAARLFYDESRLQRSGALPRALKKTLFGAGGVHGLDGQAHRRRKDLFMRQMTPEALERLERIADRHWREAIASWAGRPEVVLFDEAARILTRTAVEWVNAPMPAAGATALAQNLVARVDGFGSLGARHVRARLARSRTELWARTVIGDIRGGRLDPPRDSVAHQVALHRDADGKLLPAQVAAPERAAGAARRLRHQPRPGGVAEPGFV